MTKAIFLWVAILGLTWWATMPVVPTSSGRRFEYESTARAEPEWVYEVVVAQPEDVAEKMNATRSGRDCRLRHVVATERRVVAVFECWSGL